MSRGFPRKVIWIDLGKWGCDLGDFEIELLVQPDKAQHLIARAMRSKGGRAAVGGLAFTVCAKRVAPPQPGAAAVPPPAPAPGPGVRRT